MNTTTEVISTLAGTTTWATPQRNITIGANATSMIKSFTATCTSVYAGSPSVRYDHTNTMAVQGAAARIINPAVYSFAISGAIHAPNTCCMNTHASNAMLNGFTRSEERRVECRSRWAPDG